MKSSLYNVKIKSLLISKQYIPGMNKKFLLLISGFLPFVEAVPITVNYNHTDII